MTIRITVICKETKNEIAFMFDNSIDANQVRDTLDGMKETYRVEWDCK